jgi:hypothetical protein
MARPASERQPANMNIRVIGAVVRILMVLDRGEEPEALVYYEVNTPSLPPSSSVPGNPAGGRAFRYCRPEYTDLERLGKWDWRVTGDTRKDPLRASCHEPAPDCRRLFCAYDHFHPHPRMQISQSRVISHDNLFPRLDAAQRFDVCLS